MRVNDADRQAARDFLVKARIDGYIDEHAYEDRLTKAVNSINRSDLDIIFADLPYPKTWNSRPNWENKAYLARNNLNLIPPWPLFAAFVGGLLGCLELVLICISWQAGLAGACFSLAFLVYMAALIYTYESHIKHALDDLSTKDTRADLPVRYR